MFGRIREYGVIICSQVVGASGGERAREDRRLQFNEDIAPLKRKYSLAKIRGDKIQQSQLANEMKMLRNAFYMNGY